MLYVVHCVDRPGAGAVRQEARPAHIEYLKGQNDIIVLAGATLTDDGETMTGSHFILNVPDRAAAEAFSANDPFAKSGLFETVTIAAMRKGFWNPDHAEGA